MPVNVITNQLNASLQKNVLRKFGSGIVTSGDRKLVWPLDTFAVDYPWPLSAQPTTIESDSALDSGKSFQVIGINAGGYEDQAIVTLNGGPQLISVEFFRVYRIITLGSEVNVGNISVNHGTDVLAYIPIGVGQTQQMIGTIPIDAEISISMFILSTEAGKGANFSLWARDPQTPFLLQGNFYIESSSAYLPLDPYENLGPLTDYYAAVDVSQTSSVAAQMFGYYTGLAHEEDLKNRVR